MDWFDLVVGYFRKRYNLIISESTAEEIRMEIGRAKVWDEESRSMEVKGRDIINGLPKVITVNCKDLEDALKKEWI